MAELEDLRGRTLFWTRRRERPVVCALYERSSIVGTIEESPHERRIRMRFAGLDWTMSSSGLLSKVDRIAFGDGGDVALGEMGSDGYEIEVYGVYRHRLVREERRAEWRGLDGRPAVIFLEAGKWTYGAGGEATVPPTGVLAHAAPLVLSGVLRSIRRNLLFITEGSSS